MPGKKTGTETVSVVQSCPVTVGVPVAMALVVRPYLTASLLKTALEELAGPENDRQQA